MYDKAHEGDHVKLKLRLTYVDPVNRRNRKYVYSDEIDFAIGENKSIELDINEYAKKTGIDNPTFREAALVADEKTNNYKFISSTKTPAGSKEFDYVISQNMDTKLKEEKEEGAIILEEDEKNININYKIQEYEKDGENEDGTPKFATEPTDKTVRRRGKDIPLVHERKFEDGKEIKLAWENDRIGGAVNRNSELDLFSLLGKDRKYGIVGELKDEKHKKYYTLKIKGSDLEGWTVTLGSNLKEEKIPEDKKIDYGIEYVEDPNLYEGEEVVDREGRKGLVRDTLNHIYLLDKDGNKETVKKTLIKSEKISDIMNKIVRIGTRKPIPLDPNSFRNKEDEEEYNKLVGELTDEIEKEVEKSKENTNKENPNQEKTVDNKEDKPSQEKTEDKKEEKPSVEKEAEKETDKKEENTDPKKTKKENKKSMSTPAKGKINPKTGVAGSGSIISILAGSIIASLGLRKKND